MSKHVPFSLLEVADRLSIRELVEALAPVFADLNKYEATTHFVGQSTIFTMTADRATGKRLLYVDWVDERALS
jgi:hypothetical protein